MSKLLLTAFLLSCCIYGSEAKSLLRHLARQQERFTCPPVDGYYGIEGPCVQEYYICVGGVAYQQRCPGESVFDPVTTRCVPLAEASCRSLTTASPATSTSSTTTSRPIVTQQTTQSSTPTSTTPSGGIQFQCPADHGFFPFPNACTSEYIVCVSGSPYVTTCPNGAIFDPQSLICTEPDQASCREFKCPTPDGFYPIPGTCSGNYYSCIGGNPYVQTCPGTAVFDPATSVCVPAQSASCATTTTPSTTSTTASTTTSTTTTTTTTTRPTTTSTTTTTTTTRPTTTTAPTTTPYPCSSTGNFEYPGSCSLYYVCSSNGYIIASCPPGQVFNPSIEFCEPPGNVPGCTFDLKAYLRDLELVGQTGGIP